MSEAGVKALRTGLGPPLSAHSEPPLEEEDGEEDQRSRLDSPEVNTDATPTADTANGGIGSTVASHYNRLENKGREGRAESRIFHMRNFNNWIKSVLISEYTKKLKSAAPNDGRRSLKVLDLGCGKGGDLLKWQKAGATHVVGLDIAATSIEQAKERYDVMQQRNRGRLFVSEFYALDCSKARARGFYADPAIQFDIVSCQFAFHYCFESLPQAECMLQNISENLRVGGFFIGTTPCAYEIMARLRNANGSRRFGNTIYSVEFDEFTDIVQPPIFGAKYMFHLEEVVDCPEFLVYLPALEKLADRYGLMLVGKQKFANYFKERKDQPEPRTLLQRMMALERYPTTRPVAANSPQQYAHAEAALSESTERGPCGTLTKDEWEALTIYTVFAFKKIREADAAGQNGNH